MSDNGNNNISQFDETISTEENLLGSSVSLTFNDNSVCIKEKPKDLGKEKIQVEKWWLKKSTVQLENGPKNTTSLEKLEKSPDISSSLRDFINKENFCKDNQNNDIQSKQKDDDNENHTSAALEKYESDFESATDEDIGSILDEISKIAGTMSPIPENNRVRNDSMTEEQRSVEELLQEANILVKENGNNLKNSIDVNALADNNGNIDEATNEPIDKIKKSKLDIDIFAQKLGHTIDSDSNISILEIEEKSSLESQKKKLSLNLSNPITNVSEPEEKSIKKIVNEKKENMKKNISDVDNDFFDTLVKQSKNISEFSSNASTFEEEDFSHFLKILQDSDKTKNNESSVSSLQLLTDSFDPIKKKLPNENHEIDFLKDVNPELKNNYNSGQSEDETHKSTKSSNKNAPKKVIVSPRSARIEAKRVLNSKNELYTIGLTPRLELFADDIPKLLAQKSNENLTKSQESFRTDSEKEISPRSTIDSEDFSFKNFKALNAFKETDELRNHTNIKGVQDFEDLIDFTGSEKNLLKSSNLKNLQDSSILIQTKKSTDKIIENNNEANSTENVLHKFDQLTKPSMTLESKLDHMKNFVEDSRRQIAFNYLKKSSLPKTRFQPKTIKYPAKVKIPMKSNKESLKKNSDFLDIKGNRVKSYDSLIKQDHPEESLEILYQEERLKFLHLKKELESEVDTYKYKLKDLQILHEQEMFSLKKQNILLKAKVDEQSQKEKAETKIKNEQKIFALQREIDRQENVLNAYETENKKLMQEVKNLQLELKKNTQKPKISLGESNNESHELLESLKDLQEETVKLNLEITNLKQKNNESTVKNDDLMQQNCLLSEELDMIRDQLKTKNDFINNRLQIMTTTELDLKKKLEDTKVELSSKTGQLNSVKSDFDKFQQSIFPIEKELLDLRSKNTHLQEKLQTSKNNCEREKQLTQKLKDQVILDNKKIIDLNRQIKEMERILKRKNPDSVSALILTANSENEKLNTEKVRLLEDRIKFLENEIKIKEDSAQGKLNELQKKFTDMKEKYSSKSYSDNSMTYKPKKIFTDVGVQTIYDFEVNTDKEDKKSKVGPKSQNAKEDTHLIATIRGLKVEISNKDKNILKLNKDFQELQKTNKKLQKEREKLLNERRSFKSVDIDKMSKFLTLSDSKLVNLKMTEGNDQNYYQNGFGSGKKLSSSNQKLYDPQMYSEDSDGNKVKKLSNENEVLKDELSKINKDFIALKNKRLQDLNLLQEEHEREISSIIKEYSSKLGDSKAVKLQAQVNSQTAIIAHLQEQIEKLQDYKEQVIVLQAEREHLEGKVRMLSEKIKYLSTPSSQQLQNLQEKIAILHQRHESREMTLQKLVRDLLRSKTQCKDCKGDRGKQLCYFRQELDNIISMLQELTNV